MNHRCPCCLQPSGSVMSDPDVCCFECFHALTVDRVNNSALRCGQHRRLLPKVTQVSAVR